MKIALVNPPEDNRIYSEVPRQVNAEAGVLPPMGLLYLQSSLFISGFEDVDIIDCPALKIKGKGLQNRLKKHGCDVMGVTGHTHNLVDMLAVSKAFKEEHSDATVIWGGPHVSAFPAQSLSFECVDYGFTGEAEHSLTALLKMINRDRNVNPGDLEKIPGLIWRNEKKVFVNSPPPFIKDLDALPHPNRGTLDVKNYFYTMGQGRTASGFISSRGCPYHCTFCSTPGTAFRERSYKDVVDEMEECLELGIGELYFVDDTFNVDKGRVQDICLEIINRGVDIKWNYRGRVDLVDAPQLELAKRAGCTRIQLGVETGCDEGLEVLKKGVTTRQVKDAFRYAKSAGMTSVAYFMIGCPHEKSVDAVLRTVDFAAEIDPDYALFGILTPYPGTEIYRDAVERKIINPGQWEEFVTCPDSDFRPPVWTEYFTYDELCRMLDQAYRSFYQRPGYILKRLTEIRSPEELWRKIKAGVRMLGI